MKLNPTLLAASSLLTFLGSSSARAEDGILNFDLVEPQWAKAEVVAAAVPVAPAPDPGNQPLPIPATAGNPPMRYHSPQQLPAGVYRRAVAVALNETTSATAVLPPAPPLPTTAAVIVAAAPPEPPLPKEEKEEKQPPPTSLGLDFAMESSPAVIAAQASRMAPKPPANPLLSLFDGNSDSLVARAVGSAEGTRTPDGSINPAYFGHTDPGNRVWNMGTFSYQHGANSPEEADQKQLARLKNQGDVLRQRAVKQGLNLTLEETLNGLDLANQSPLAAIGRVGYIERLAEAKANGFEGSEAILIARTRSYINPNTGRWNAPGLGNTEPSIRRDQKRRADAVAKAIAAYGDKNPDLRPQTWTLQPSPEPVDNTSVASEEDSKEAVDFALQMWTSPSDPVAQSEPAADESVAATLTEPEEPAVLTASSNDGLAALWRVTVDKFLPTGGDQERADAIQPAPGAVALLDRRAPEPSISKPAVNPDQPQAESDVGVEEPSPVAADVEASSALDAGEQPTWATAREGNQITPGIFQAQGSPLPPVSPGPIPGAVPDSAVYMPTPPTPEAAAQPEPTGESSTRPETAAPAEAIAAAAESSDSESKAPEAEADSPNVSSGQNEPAGLDRETLDQPGDPNPAAISDESALPQVDGDDFSGDPDALEFNKASVGKEPFEPAAALIPD